MTIFAIGIYGSYFLLQFVFETFEENRITIKLETYNLHWTHTFPAVSICMARPDSWEQEWELRRYLVSYYEENGLEPPDEYDMN